MHICSRAVLMSLLVLAAFLGVAHAKNRLTVCNQSGGPLKIAALVFEGNSPLLREGGWGITGWGEIPAGCKEMVANAGPLRIFLSILDEKDLLLKFPFRKGDAQDVSQTGSATSERFFCVARESFKRILSTLDEHESCPKGWYRQLFNMYIGVNDNTHFTWTVK